MSELILGGQARRLSYPWPSVNRLKLECGINCLKTKDVDLLDPVTLSAFVWAGCLAEEPGLMRGESDGRLSLKDTAALVEAVSAALLRDLGVSPDPLTSGASSGATADAPPSA